MGKLEELRSTKTLKDVAHLLGMQAKALSYVLYVVDSTQKYTEFEIPKKAGGVRKIRAPMPQLKAAQRRLASLLTDCWLEIESKSDRAAIAHGFLPDRSIVTNANAHCRRRFVLNIDIEGFFDSINFGRVRGLLIADKEFGLDPKVATVLAQLACYEGCLPQGSPASPIISNLVGKILDGRLVRVAKKYGLRYSRYVDDITFSTNAKEFPPDVAFQEPDSKAEWVVGKVLRTRVEDAGFRINESKTRVMVRASRQVVTGLVVNRKVNVSASYYRNARAMANSLFHRGSYHRQGESEALTELAALEGILSHICYVRNSADLRDEQEKKSAPTAVKALYNKFQFYKNVLARKDPLVICEGLTDSIYIRCAVRSLIKDFPSLGVVNGERIDYGFSCLRYGSPSANALGLAGGTGDLAAFIGRYKRNLDRFPKISPKAPVILLVDNDSGLNPITKAAKQHFGMTIDIESKEHYYLIHENLYLVKTPESGVDVESCIENLFAPKVLDTKLGGKKFDPNKDHDDAGAYGKVAFAKSVVVPGSKSIDFSDFGLLLGRLAKVMAEYGSKFAGAC